MINKVTVNGVIVELSAQYLHGNISTLLIDDKDTSVLLRFPVTDEDLKEHIKEGVKVLYGEATLVIEET